MHLVLGVELCDARLQALDLLAKLGILGLKLFDWRQHEIALPSGGEKRKRKENVSESKSTTLGINTTVTWLPPAYGDPKMYRSSLVNALHWLTYTTYLSI